MAKDTGKTTVEPEPGADNNKRLAFLEAGVSALAIAVSTAVGVAVDTIEDPIAAATGALETMKAELAAREQSIKDLEAKLEIALSALGAAPSMLAKALEAAGVELQPDADPVLVAVATIANAGVAKNEISRLADYLLEKHSGAIEGSAVDTAINVMDAASDEGDKGDGDEQPSPRDSAREAGPEQPSVDRQDLRALVEEGQTFELVFSDGKHELLHFEAKRLKSSELRRLADGRYLVIPPIAIRGVGGSVSDAVHGVALLVGDEQVAYCAFERPLAVGPGEQRQFAGSLLFG